MSRDEVQETKIKLSGLTNTEDAIRAAEAGIDIASCVFWAQSPRYVTIERAWEIRQALPPHVEFAGIFVNAPVPLVQRIAEIVRLDHIQLFGKESQKDFEALGPKAFKAMTVEQPGPLESIIKPFIDKRAQKEARPAVLLNLRDEAEARWDIAAPIAQRAPTILASSAIDPESVQEAVSSSQAWGVDVWDCVEESPGKVDLQRLRQLIHALRAVPALAGQ